jgi:hypothetical protein
LRGATLGAYLLVAFVLRFWSEGLLLAPNNIGYGNGPPPESHFGLIVLVLVGFFVTFLGALQSIFLCQISEKWTRFSLWLNFFAIFCDGLAGFGTRWTAVPLHFFVLFVVVAFPLGLLLSLVNILLCLRRRKQGARPHTAPLYALVFRQMLRHLPRKSRPHHPVLVNGGNASRETRFADDCQSHS